MLTQFWGNVGPTLQAVVQQYNKIESTSRVRRGSNTSPRFIIGPLSQSSSQWRCITEDGKWKICFRMILSGSLRSVGMTAVTIIYPRLMGLAGRSLNPAVPSGRLLERGPGAVVEAACLENRRSRVRTTLWNSSFKDTNC